MRDLVDLINEELRFIANSLLYFLRQVGVLQLQDSSLGQLLQAQRLFHLAVVLGLSLPQVELPALYWLQASACFLSPSELY